MTCSGVPNTFSISSAISGLFDMYFVDRRIGLKSSGFVMRLLV